MKLTVEELKRLAEEGYTDGEIAEKYDMHIDSVRKKRAKHDIPKYDKASRLDRQWPEIRQLNEMGYNDREIAEKLGCITQDGVRRVRSIIGLPKTDYGERLDKRYTCWLCKKEIVIKRKERKQRYCPECKAKRKQKP